MPTLAQKRSQPPSASGSSRKGFEEALRCLALAVEMHEGGESGHSERVSGHCARTAQALGLDETSCERIRLASLLHDVGKLAMPRELLAKPGKLTEREWELVERHPEVGYLLLAWATDPVLELAATIARSHHERFDGRGYPDGLAAEAIPLAARIAAVADVFDALTSSRPYRRALTLDEALDELRAGRGGQFDPDVLDAFLDRLEDAGEAGARPLTLVR